MKGRNGRRYGNSGPSGLRADLGRFVCCGLAPAMRHCEKSEGVMDHEAALGKANEIAGRVLAPAASTEPTGYNRESRS